MEIEIYCRDGVLHLVLQWQGLLQSLETVDYKYLCVVRLKPTQQYICVCFCSMNWAYKLPIFGVLLKSWLKYGIHWKYEIIELSLTVTDFFWSLRFLSLLFLVLAILSTFYQLYGQQIKELSWAALLFFSAMLTLADGKLSCFVYYSFTPLRLCTARIFFFWSRKWACFPLAHARTLMTLS